MKYGETLRQRSIPAWSHYNIDYDDIKRLIKDRTTPGSGKTVSIPGRGDDKLVDLENVLFQIFADQHQRIDLFVKSKTGEIRRRLDHANKQFRQLSCRQRPVAEQRVPIARLDRYVRLENDVVKVGDELRSLARFTSAQRTAFRKLLKKYKKWTGSTSLEFRVRDEILNDPKSFTQLDFGPMLEDYSETLQEIRHLFEAMPSHNSTGSVSTNLLPASPIQRLSSSLASRSKVQFDVAFDTVPLGENGGLASYFVHPENVVELQIFLLQYFQHFTSESRPSSTATPTSPARRVSRPECNASSECDYSLLAADNLDRFAQKQASVTVAEREHSAGRMPQRAAVCIRWNSEEEPLLSARTSRSMAEVSTLRKKYIDNFFDRTTRLSQRKLNVPGDSCKNLDAVRDLVLKDPSFQPLYYISSTRARFVAINNNSEHFSLGTLDTNISMRPASDGERSEFPFALLQIRQEGTSAVDLLATLDQSHLVERVRGFSLQYHALWQTSKPTNISPPFWMAILSRDIRKLPPPALPHDSARVSPSATQPSSTNSVVAVTDSTTAVETARPSSNDIPDQLETRSSRAFRKKRRRYPQDADGGAQPRYWSEYDHPEDGDAANDFVIYIDPNELSTLDRIFDKLARLFRAPHYDDDEVMFNTPATPKDDESSSDEGERTTLARPRPAITHNYGTLATPSLPAYAPPGQPSITPICLIASLIILTVASFLTITSRRKLVREVDAAVLFAIASSLVFALVGFGSLCRRRDVGFAVWSAASCTVVVVAVWSGGLVARMLG